MSKNNLIFKHTKLETTNDVKNTLSWKIEAIKADKLPVDTTLADYISFAIDYLVAQQAQLKSVKAEIAQRDKVLKDQIESIKAEGGAFLLENGLERLNGVICSSVTVSKAKEPITTITETKEFVMTISQVELEELLIGLGKAEMKTVVTEKTSNAIPAKLKINKRKIALAEVEE